MNCQNITHLGNRRNFLKQATLGVCSLGGALIRQPLLTADSGSRIEALELLVLKQKGEQRRVMKIVSSTGAAGYCSNAYSSQGRGADNNSQGRRWSQRRPGGGAAGGVAGC